MSAANARRRDRKTYTFSMSMSDVVWAGIGGAFALTVFFLFGVLVGRGYVPVEPGSEATTAPAAHEVSQAAGQASVHGESDGAEEPELMEPGVLKAEDLGYQDQLTGGEKPTPQADSTDQAQEGEQAAAQTADGQAADSQAADGQAEDEAQAVPGFDPDNLPAPEPGEEIYNYVYQAAAFKDKAAAEELVERLGGMNLPAAVAVGEASGNTWYRVRIPFTGTPSQTRPLRDVTEGITGEKPVMVSKKKP